MRRFAIESAPSHRSHYAGERSASGMSGAGGREGASLAGWGGVQGYVAKRAAWQSGAVNESVPDEHGVVAGLLCRRGRALLVHRSARRRWYPDAWDLPGGHVQEGEAPHHALVRELREELGITIEAGDEPFAHVQGPDFRMDIWTIDGWTG